MDLNLAYIGVYVCDLERSVRFYQDVLDFVQIFRYENQGTPIAFLQNGTCVLELIEKPASAGRTDGCVDHIALAVTDLAQAHRELLPRRRKLDPVPRPGRRASGTESDRRHMKNAPSRAADWTMHESPRASARGLPP